MCDTASLELSKELFQLSGWDYATNAWLSPLDDPHPVYDLGYLLRKLPQKGDSFIHKCDTIPVKYLAVHEGSGISASSNTPEDAACKLAIALFKRGILKRE